MAEQLRSTDTYFGLDDRWAATAPGEFTHYHDLGHGVPVTFVHGSGPGVSAAANWWLNLPALAAEHRVIALDLLGFGHTVPREDAVYGIRAWAEHVMRLLDALEIRRTWLVGNSLGGWIALQMALDYGNRILGVVSMGTGGAPRPAAASPLPGQHSTAADMGTALKVFVANETVLTGELIEARRQCAIAPGAEDRFRAVITARDFDRVHNPLTDDALARLDLPVLLVHGREDRVIPASRSWDLAKTLPGADLYLMANCGHWSQIERPDGFNILVTEFLRAHRPTPQ
jgi:2-hydroxymuconate-semialdehyde hydrolase